MKRFAVFCLCLILLAGCAGTPEAPLPEKIELRFFYDEPCGSCDGTAEFFDLFNELVGDVKDTYPFTITTYNVFKSESREQVTAMIEEAGLSTENLYYPMVMLGSKLYSGWESIEKNLREAFLTAGEDIFVYEYVYLPAADGGKPLFQRQKPDKNHATLVYFYRITCEECGQVKPIIDGLPDTITVDGKETALDIICFNSRSGNNGDRISALFEAYNVPDEDQMVPIVFLADTYLAGYEDISANLETLLAQGAGQNFQFP